MKKYENLFIYMLIIMFVLRIVWCCKKSVKYLTHCLHKKHNELIIDKGFGYSNPTKVISKEELEKLKKELNE